MQPCNITPSNWYIWKSVFNWFKSFLVTNGSKPKTYSQTCKNVHLQIMIDHLPPWFQILSFYIINDIWTKSTCQQRNGHYCLVPKVVDVHRFGFIFIKSLKLFNFYVFELAFTLLHGFLIWKAMSQTLLNTEHSTFVVDDIQIAFDGFTSQRWWQCNNLWQERAQTESFRLLFCNPILITT